MTKKLVIIGANDFQNKLILKAKKLGYETHVFAWKDGSIGEKTADFFYPISIIEKEKILEQCEKIKPCGICSIASDLATITVNYVAEKLGLHGNPFNSTFQCTNKYEMRKVFKTHHIRTPKFIKTTSNFNVSELNDFKFPLIVKPTDRSGSRGITKIYSINELEKAISYSVKDSFEKSAIIEEFIEGNEYSCECISYRGKHYFLAFTKKFTTGAPNFIETGHIQPSDIDISVQEKIKKEIFEALDALNIKNGASHTEFKIDENGNMTIIEIGARMGGDCIGSDLVRLSTGYDFVKMVIDVAVGLEPDFSIDILPKTVAIKVLFTEKDLEELETLKINNKKNIYMISELNKKNIGNVVDSSSRLGYYIYFPNEGESNI